MSAVVILVPVVSAAWPAFSGAVMAAAASLGYSVVKQAIDEVEENVEGSEAYFLKRGKHEVSLEIPNSEIVTDQLGREKNIAVERDGVTVKFARDARGKASVCVSGQGRTDAELTAIGEELSQCVVQQYVYQHLREELASRQFHIVEEGAAENNAIRLKVRLWEGAHAAA